jgi:transposase-like protein
VGSIDKYCPHCGSEKVFVVELEFEGNFSFQLEHDSAPLWYECGDCHSEWEPHEHYATHRMIGTHEC